MSLPLSSKQGDNGPDDEISQSELKKKNLQNQS